MFKHFAIFSLLFTLVCSSVFGAETTTKKKKKKRSHSSSRTYKPTKHSRRSRRYRHHGNGPDLKSITTESPYKEDPTNGVTPVETKQPGPAATPAPAPAQQ